MICPKLRGHFTFAAVVFFATVALAQEAKIKVQVIPADGAIFVDGKPYEHSAGILNLAPGEHTIAAYNYGFAPQVRKVTVQAGEDPDLVFKLEPMPGEVQGPWGNLQIKGIHGDYLVYLNGRGPEYFIGRVEEVKGNRVVLPPGQQHVIIINPNGNREVYSAYVIVRANQRAILHVDKSDTYYEKWPEGAQLNSLPRVGPGTVAIEPVHVEATAGPCGRVKWVSNGYHTMLKLNGTAVAQGGGEGEQAVDPRQDTTYTVETFGPGGVTTAPVTVKASRGIQPSLSAYPAEVNLVRENGVIQPGATTLKWNAPNAKTIAIDPLGSVTGPSGEKEVKFTAPETLKYTITASDECGDSGTAYAEVKVNPPLEIPNEAPVCGDPPNVPCKLPPTGSPLPLIGVLGIGSLISGLVVRKIRKQ